MTTKTTTTGHVSLVKSAARYALARSEGMRPTYRRDVPTLRRAVDHFVFLSVAEFAGLPGVDVAQLRADAFTEAARLLLIRRATSHVEGARVSLARTRNHYRAARHAVSAILRSNRAGLTGLRNPAVAAERKARLAWELARDGYGESVDIELSDATEDTDARTVAAFMSADTSHFVNVRPGKQTGHSDVAANGVRVLAGTLSDGARDLFTRELYRLVSVRVDGKRTGTAYAYPACVALADHDGSVAGAARDLFGKDTSPARKRLQAMALAESVDLFGMVDTMRATFPASATF